MDYSLKNIVPNFNDKRKLLEGIDEVYDIAKKYINTNRTELDVRAIITHYKDIDIPTLLVEETEDSLTNELKKVSISEYYTKPGQFISNRYIVWQLLKSNLSIEEIHDKIGDIIEG